MNTRITIKDIAKALGIHHSTVSRALRNDSRVREETRKRVMDYAGKHGYQTNLVARELRGEKRSTLAIIVPNISHEFFSNIVSQVTSLASRRDFVVSVFQSNESIETEKQIIDTIIQYNFTGVLASLSIESKNTSHFKTLIDNNIPLVMFDRVCQDYRISRVTIDNRGIIREAVRHFYAKGYQRIAHISGPSDINVFGDRQKGYREELTDLHLDYNKVFTIKKDFSFKDGQKIAYELLNSKLPPDAIVCDSSNVLFGLLKTFKSEGISIPEDIGVIVFGQNSVLEILDPPITSIEQPENEISRISFDLILEKIEDEKIIKNETILIPAKIVHRDSV